MMQGISSASTDRRRSGQPAKTPPRVSRALRKVKDGANRRKHAARLARIYARIANVRADALRKATSGLAVRYETVVAEDLNVTGMLANHRLARAVADQGFGQARRMLSIRPSGTAETLLVADRCIRVPRPARHVDGESQA
jgi:hypothetical protein